MHPRSVLSVVLAGLLAWPLPAQQPTGPRPQVAQPPPSPQPAPEKPQPGTPAPAPQPAPPAPTEPPGVLKLVVIQGEGAINNIRTRSATAPIVEVRDENDKPVAGAEVIFQLPPAGPGGVFHGWMRSQTVRSDAQGRAAATGYAPNDQAGRFNIKVTASLGNKTGAVVIGQSNADRGGSGPGMANGRSGWWKIALGVGSAGAVIGAVAATRNGGGSAPAAGNPITITPGPISVGSPR